MFLCFLVLFCFFFNKNVLTEIAMKFQKKKKAKQNILSNLPPYRYYKSNFSITAFPSSIKNTNREEKKRVSKLLAANNVRAEEDIPCWTHSWRKHPPRIYFYIISVNSQFVRALTVQQPTNQQLIASNNWLLRDYCLNKSQKFCALVTYYFLKTVKFNGSQPYC